ncbi:MAG: DUF6382 domain-containing protein [Lachnospiraceae bacterium]
MEITYKRNLKNSYMCVEQEGKELEICELMMLQKSKIPYFLPMQTIVIDGKMQYQFEISGKQQLSDYLAGRKINQKEFRRILFSLQNSCSILSEYLLRESGVCLEENFIYVNLANQEICFTYLPFWEESLRESVKQWMERLLKLIDHQDKEAVEFGYQVYQQMLQENVAMKEMLGQILEQENSANMNQIEEKNGQESSKQLSEKVQEESNTASKSLQITEKEKKAIFLKNLSERGKREKGLTAQELVRNGLKLPEKVQTIWENKKENLGLLWKKKKQGEYQPVFQVEQVAEEEKQQQHPTVYLGKQQPCPSGRLTYQGVGKCSDFIITGEAFLLGTQEGQVDGKIESEGISRLHAKILQQDKVYYIEDLNSTNGTYLNGELLEYHEKKVLNKKDILCFAGEEYVFS